MARRSDHTREELKEMAISSGEKLISSEGLSKFSARKIAKDIGYTVGTVYNIFGSHDNLLLHINGATLDAMHAFISGRITEPRQGADAIKELAELYIEFASNHYNTWSVLFEFNLSQDSPLPDWYMEKIEKLFHFVEHALKHLDGAQLHAKTLWASIHGICHLGLTGKLDVVGAESIRALTYPLIDNYLRGLES